MSDSCAVKLGDTYHLVCGVNLYADGPVSLLVGALDPVPGDPVQVTCPGARRR